MKITVRLRSGKVFQGFATDEDVNLPFFPMTVEDTVYMIPWTSVEWIKVED